MRIRDMVTLTEVPTFRVTFKENSKDVEENREITVSLFAPTFDEAREKAQLAARQLGMRLPHLVDILINVEIPKE